jgi:alpha-ketoglutarate-dependent taurine dioxygenase
MKLNRIINENNLAWNSSSFSSEKEFTYKLSEKVLTELKYQNLPETIEEIPLRIKNFPNLENAVSEFQNSHLLGGNGFGLITGLNPHEFGEDQRDVIYWMICNLLGEPLKQNIQGEMRVEVTDLGKTMEEGGRYHQTSHGGSLHTDSPQWLNVPDFLGLLCLRPAKSGGESRFVSAYMIHNNLLETRPDLLNLLYEPFHFDKRGEYLPGESPTTFAPIFSYDGKNLKFRYLKDYIVAGHIKAGEPLSDVKEEALEILDRLLDDENQVVTVDLKVGNISFVNNHRVVHGRTGFVDYQEKDKKRVMISRIYTCWRDE